MAVRTEPLVGEHIGLAEYQRLVDAGALEGAHVELIDGVVCAMSPKSRAHEKAIRWLNGVLTRGVDPAHFEVGVTAALTIGDSEPEPDLWVVEVGTPEPNHPASAALVVEIAVSSQHRDLVVKPRIYASAGVPVYWVVDLDRRQATVHAEPTTDGYGSVTLLGPDGRLDAAHIGLEPIAVAALLAAADR